MTPTKLRERLAEVDGAVSEAYVRALETVRGVQHERER
jgi:hypothetical protein